MILPILVISFILFISRTWVAEDAYIFFRYADNLVHGYGPVFNLGERVEGFTSPLWLFVLSFFRLITGYELRPLSIFLGLVLSVASVYIIVKSEKLNFPVGVLLLISTSFIRDYATSGFETSLTMFLTTLVALQVKNERIFKKIWQFGLVLALLVLTRPEALLVLAYVVLLVFKNNVKNLKKLFQFVVFPFLILGSYQVFRILYYKDFLPNTYYAKKGGEIYLSQGFNYLNDFILSYPITLLIILIGILLLIISKEKDKRWAHLVIISILLSAYVLRSGGDYMHGRSLLIPFVLLCIAVNHSFDKYFRFSNQSEFSMFIYSIIYAVVIGIGIFQIPLTVKKESQINFINDERSHFGVNFKIFEFFDYFSQSITYEFGWAERGFYYRDISEAVGMPISVVNWNIGLFGYAAGKDVSIEGAVLIDKYIAKQKIEKRGKIGHENLPHWDYVFTRKPAFSYTPFTYWNDHAQFKYTKSKFAYAITDNSNDSFVPVFDLSNEEFINKYSSLVGVNIKDKIDNAQIEFLNNVTSDGLSSKLYKNYKMDIMEYFDFLKNYWYPYTSQSNQEIYNNTIYRLNVSDYKGSYTKFLESI